MKKILLSHIGINQALKITAAAFGIGVIALCSTTYGILHIYTQLLVSLPIQILFK